MSGAEVWWSAYLSRFASYQTESNRADAKESEHDSQRIRHNSRSWHCAHISEFGERGKDKSHTYQHSEKTNSDHGDSFHFWFFLLSI